MTIKEQTIEYLKGLALIEAWPELYDMLPDGEGDCWRLPALSCRAVGGRLEQAIPAAAAIALLQRSIILIDDLLDSDPRGAYHRIGAPAASNLASAFQAAGMEAITCGDLDPAAELAVLRNLHRMMLTTARGQHLDVQCPADEAAYWRVVETKSTAFYAAAFHSGAVCGGASSEIAEQLFHVGVAYGEVTQIQDDVVDAMAIPANADWIMMRSSLPMIFTQVVDHPERKHFLELRAAASRGEEEALIEAQAILVRCGAISYCIDQVVHRHEKIKELLAQISLVCRSAFDRMIAELIEPVDLLLGESKVSTVGPAAGARAQTVFR